MDQTPSLLFGTDSHHPGHETINPGTRRPVRCAGWRNLHALQQPRRIQSGWLCSGVGPTLTIMALTARAHRPATLTLLKPQGTIQEVVAVVVARCDPCRW